MNRTKLASLLALVLLTAPSLAAETHPGIVSIDWKDHLGEREPVVTVQLSPTLIRFMASMASGAAAEATEIQGVNEIIGQLRQVRVEVYDTGDRSGTNWAAAEEETEKLKSLGWETVVRAREDDERVDVMMLPQGDSIVGFVVIASEDDDLAFVNVAGDFDPASLGKHLGAIVRQVSDGKIKLKDLVDLDIEELIEEVEEAR